MIRVPSALLPLEVLQYYKKPPRTETRSKAMRLTPRQVDAITKATRKIYGNRAGVVLFGSRVDDRRRGGDIDLLIRPDPGLENPGLRHKLQLLGELERALGERKIDVIIETPSDSRPIVRIAREQGVPL